MIEGSRCRDAWSCNWLSVSDFMQFDWAVMIYKRMNGLCPDNLRERLINRSQLSNHPTSNLVDLDIPRLNLEFSTFFRFWSKDVEGNPIAN